MFNLPGEQNLKNLNYYKIIFHKQDTLPVGHFSRNLLNKIKDPSYFVPTSKEKCSEYFNPISESNIFKIQKLYSKFQRNKSANRYHKKNYSAKFKNQILSRPLSQYSTLIDLPGYTNHISLKNNIEKNMRPFSHMRSESTLLLEKIHSYNISKIGNKKLEKNVDIIYNTDKKNNTNKENNLYIKKNLTKKNNIAQRSSSAQIIAQRNKEIKDPNIKSLIKHEMKMKLNKKLLKGRLKTALARHLVINKETFQDLNKLYKNEEDKKDDNKNDNNNDKNNNPKKSKDFHYVSHYSGCFSKIRPPFRYEDYYFSPMELLKKYFTKEEIIMLKSSPGYFGLNKYPFKNSDFEFCKNLLSKLDYEDNTETTIDTHQMIQNQKKKKIKFNIDKENEKLKNVFKEKKIIRKKREPIKGKDFVSHYERDIEPDEGTVAYFERKYLKYLNNKEKKMEKKINNLKFKKGRFEYLKNLRTKKLQEEKNIQRITTPYINIIKKNYLRSNSNINI